MPTNEPVDDLDPDNFTEVSPCPANDKVLAVLGDLLMEKGITRVVIRYCGSGDSGCVDAVEYEPEGAVLPKAVEDQLCDLAEDYCPEGYENNDGGYGSVTLFPFHGVAELEHYDRYEDSEEMQTSGIELPEDLCEALARTGVTALSLTFDGYGDSGQVDHVENTPETVEIDQDLVDRLEDLLMESLPSGWKNNAGGFGTFTVDVAESSVEADTWWRVEADGEMETTRWRWRQ